MHNIEYHSLYKEKAMNNWIEKIYKLLFPERCILCDDVIANDAPFCSDCYQLWSKQQKDECVLCGKSLHECECIRLQSIKQSVFLFWYSGEALKSLIYRQKSFLCSKTNRFFATLMVNEIRSKIEPNKKGELPFEVITYVPRSKKAVVKNGYDQAAELAKELSKQLNIPCVCLVTRKRGGQQQKKLGYTVRLANIKGVFHPNELCKSYKSVLLIDDVVTTGATINAVADALKNGGVRNVYCAAIAKTQQTFRRKPKAEKL